MTAPSTPTTDLHALALFLADHAVVESGKVYVNGGFWNKMQFPAFPVVHSFAVVAVLHVPWRAYHSRHRFSVSFQTADAEPVPGEIQGEFQIGAAPDMKVGDPTVMPFSAMVNNFTIERPGDYACVLQVDGTEISRFVYRVTQVFQPFTPPGIGPANPAEG